MPVVMQRPLLLTAILLLEGVLPTMGWSADTTSAEPAPRLSSEQQQSALEFVKEHHPQLNGLITRLKKRDPAEYDKAVTEVFRTHERLQRMKERDRPRYEVELKRWKVDSRIRLLAARMAAVEASERSPELESQLRELLNQRTDLRLQLLTLERERLSNRLERIDAQVNQLSSEREAVIDREVERLQRRVRVSTDRVFRQSADGNTKNAGLNNRGEPKKRAEQKTGASRQDRPAERPVKKSTN